MQWQAFKLDDKVYDLSHLNDFSHVFVVPAKGDRPANNYTVDITFSHHCFTDGIPRARASYDRRLLYRSHREDRLFSQDRYDLSFRLPDIIRSMMHRKCHHTGHGNFYTVQLTDADGTVKDYDIFFNVARSTKLGRLTLFVQSAFLRDQEKLPPTRPIRFEIILYITLHSRPIKA